MVATNNRVSVSGRLITLNAVNLAAGAAGFPQITATISATTYLVPAAAGPARRCHRRRSGQLDLGVHLRHQLLGLLRPRSRHPPSAMSFVNGIVNDLRERRLWPIALVLLVALVAVPVLLSNSSSDSRRRSASFRPHPRPRGARFRLSA